MNVFWYIWREVFMHYVSRDTGKKKYKLHIQVVINPQDHDSRHPTQIAPSKISLILSVIKKCSSASNCCDSWKGRTCHRLWYVTERNAPELQQKGGSWASCQRSPLPRASRGCDAAPWGVLQAADLWLQCPAGDWVFWMRRHKPVFLPNQMNYLIY